MWKVWLAGIVAFAFFLRFYAVGSNPPSLYWDEVAIGYNAWSILETGRDEYGRRLPILFESFNEWKLPGYIYSVVPSVAAFGKTPLAVRLPAVLYGTLTVAALYWFVVALSKKRSLALVAALLLAVNPWHLHMSRTGFEATGMVFWAVLGFALLMTAREKPRLLSIAGASFVVAIYFYNAARLVLPLIVFSLLLVQWEIWWTHKKTLLIAFLIGFLLLLPLVVESFKPGQTIRFEQVSLFHDPSLLEPAIAKIEEDGGWFLSRVLHHRGLVYTQAVAESYMRHFSSAFLFFSGDPNSRHSIPGMGMLYIIELPLLLLGVGFVLKQGGAARNLLLSWVLIAPIAAALTLPTPHALRTLLLSPVLMVFIAFGIVGLIGWVSRVRRALAVSMVGVIVILYGISGAVFFEEYAWHYPSSSAQAWGDGYPQLFAWLREHQEEYATIAVTGEYWKPYIFALFYLPIHPAEYLTHPTNHSQFAKFFFGPSGWDQGDPHYKPNFEWEDIVERPGTLAVLAPYEVSGIVDTKRIAEITRTDGSIVFIIVQS